MNQKDRDKLAELIAANTFDDNDKKFPNMIDAEVLIDAVATWLAEDAPGYSENFHSRLRTNIPYDECVDCQPFDAEAWKKQDQGP